MLFGFGLIAGATLHGFILDRFGQRVTLASISLLMIIFDCILISIKESGKFNWVCFVVMFGEGMLENMQMSF